MQNIENLKLIVLNDSQIYHKVLNEFVTKQKNLKRLNTEGEFLKNYHGDSQFQLKFLKGSLYSWR
jgi:hypothetical protein